MDVVRSGELAFFRGKMRPPCLTGQTPSTRDCHAAHVRNLETRTPSTRVPRAKTKIWRWTHICIGLGDSYFHGLWSKEP
eukprot:3449598-Amphidinium_carterae.1